MPIRNLNKMFYPQSVAVIGASNREGAAGHVVMRNLLRGGFEGPIMPVCHDQRAVAGVLAYPNVAALPMTPDLAVVATDSQDVPAAIDALGARGTRAAVILTAAPAPGSEARGRSFRDAIREPARAHGMRILGPTCLGLMVPHIGLDASSAHVSARTGSMAFVSQSAAICTGVLDWAKRRNIGFAHFISLGDVVDLEFSDLLDFLGSDAMTRAILLFVEGIENGRAFMSAGRGASRNKPVIVIKAGRVPEGQRLAVERSGAPIAGDGVYDAAISRAGMLRVSSFGELFAAVETLARGKAPRGDRLAVIANGHGLAIMAADALIMKGGCLAELADATRMQLADVLPEGAPAGNPISVTTDAAPSVYGDAARILLKAHEVDAVMVLHVPTAMASSTEAAARIIEVAKQNGGNLLTCWMGGETVEAARGLFAEARIPTYDTPTQAIDAFMHLVRFRRNQEILMETPPSKPLEFTPAADAARMVVDHALARGRHDVGEVGAHALLAAYGIPCLETHVVTSADAAVEFACRLGFPVIIGGGNGADTIGPDGTREDTLLDTPAAVRAAAERAFDRLDAAAAPGNRAGVTVKKLPMRLGGRLVRLEIETDPVFGPVILFGAGGPTASLLRDRAVALPPLNIPLARDLVSRTRIAKALQANGTVAAADLEALYLTLVKLSQMTIDIPEIVSLDINPMILDRDGLIATSARLTLTPLDRRIQSRLAIRPYPKEQEEEFQLASGHRVLLRPIRPEDEPEHYDFLSRITPEDLRMRFFGVIGRMSHAEMARFTQIDYDREMAFIATAAKPTGDGRETLGVVRTITDPNNDTAEYAILVRSDLKGQGLGRKLMDKMVRYCRTRGTRRIVGQVLRENRSMLGLVTDLGFVGHAVPDDDVVDVQLPLEP